MNLNIPGDYANLINEAVASGLFSNPEDALKHALALFADERKIEQPLCRSGESHEAWKMRFRKFVAECQPTGHPVDDSRESIYPDRV